ncbi:TPD1 protein homolog 1-like [Diospyros lotus]|uniref:TPD1 protein homolog 1-like n=1 Tax=Diospyros lotus TaxID=55363 RepID=UPI00224F3FC6|nr:TPD1 protein homolog 1-like [Diospyros lotus]
MITVVMVLFYLMMLIIVPCNSRLCSGISSAEADKDPNITTAPALQLQQAYLAHGSCTNRDISISQSRVTSTGIPQYIVQIVNTCVSGCAPSNIHLHCGWFASARMVNPRIFKRLDYDDCLVNAGKPLKTSQVLRFTYSNSFMYPLGFKSAHFC